MESKSLVRQGIKIMAHIVQMHRLLSNLEAGVETTMKAELIGVLNNPCYPDGGWVTVSLDTDPIFEGVDMMTEKVIMFRIEAAKLKAKGFFDRQAA